MRLFFQLCCCQKVFSYWHFLKLKQNQDWNDHHAEIPTLQHTSLKCLHRKFKDSKTRTSFTVFKKTKKNLQVEGARLCDFGLFGIGSAITSVDFLVSHEETQIHINCESVVWSLLFLKAPRVSLWELVSTSATCCFEPHNINCFPCPDLKNGSPLVYTYLTLI